MQLYERPHGGRVAQTSGIGRFSLPGTQKQTLYEVASCL